MSQSCMATVRLITGGMVLGLLVACSPTFDWRDVRPAGAGVQLLFPCKPATEARSIELAGHPVRMTMLACRAGDSMFGLAFADAGEASRVSPAIAALRAAQASNFGAPARALGPAVVPGANPVPAPERFEIDGRLPDGTLVRQQLVYFARGTQVYQAAVMGPAEGGDAAGIFFEGIRSTP